MYVVNVIVKGYLDSSKIASESVYALATWLIMKLTSERLTKRQNGHNKVLSPTSIHS